MKNTLTYILALLLMVGLVSAVSVTNVLSPAVDGTTTTTRSITFEFTLDEEPAACFIQIGLTNGTTLGNYSAGTLATTKSGKTYNLTSYSIPIDSAVSGSHNWSIYCGASAATASLINTYDFNVRVNTPTATSPTEDEIKTSQTFSLGMTVPVIINTSAGYICQYNSTLSNGTSTGWNLFSQTQTALLNTTINQSANITFASYYDASAGTYYTCNSAFNCAGISNAAGDINVLKGNAVWVLTNANISINRTVVSG